MDRALRICGVTVNHNTSHFVELMLRTLLLTADRAALALDLTVLDNRSDDAHQADLQSYLAAAGVAHVQTGFDTGVAPEKHGVALADFVGRTPDCSHYLFLDADMWFMEAGTVATMLAELRAAPPGAFANQARIAGYYAGRVIEGQGGVPGAGAADGQPPHTVTFGERSFAQVVVPRCSPVCSLVANTALFRELVATVGLAPAWRFGVGEAYFYDTFALMTQVMATHGRGFVVSSRTVNHFTQVSYMPEHRGVKDRDCLAMLGELRSGRGMEREIFFESEWVRQQRATSQQ